LENKSIEYREKKEKKKGKILRCEEEEKREREKFISRKKIYIIK
jgi:hypothetical protein